MRQFLFKIPLSDLLIDGGWWLPGYGACLLAAFLIVVWWGGRRSVRVGLPSPKLQDMAICLFVTGIVGARVLFMLQYPQEFDLTSVQGVLLGFVCIWKGGLVVYGSLFGGFLGYLAFRHFVLKRMNINGWKLADVAAPLLAVGMAVGRIGCYLNGCCWGQVAVPECQPVALGSEAGQFPLIPSHAQKQLCNPPDRDARLPQICGLQTRTGFTIAPNDPLGIADPRVVEKIEPASAAAAAGLQPGDRIVKVNGEANVIIVTVRGLEPIQRKTLGPHFEIEEQGVSTTRFEKLADYRELRAKLTSLPVTVSTKDRLAELIANWPKGGAGLDLVVERNGVEVPLSFTPKTVTFFPTQIYETISMLLLTLLLVTFQPFRRHDGQVMVLLMAGYAMHRFLNEAIRIEPTYALGLTLSQWISVGLFIAAVGLELFLRRTQPKLPPGPQPLGV